MEQIIQRNSHTFIIMLTFNKVYSNQNSPIWLISSSNILIVNLRDLQSQIKSKVGIHDEIKRWKILILKSKELNNSTMKFIIHKHNNCLIINLCLQKKSLW